VSGTWSVTNNDSNWGDPKFNNVYDNRRYNDAPGYLEYNIPTGMKSAYISHLQWSTGGYVDVHGVQSDGGLVFLRRINTRQAVENTNEGNPDQHDGSTITFIGSGLNTFSKIRLTNKLGRFHFTGLAFTPNANEGTEGTGMVHSAQISDMGSFALSATTGTFSGAIYTDGNRSVIRGTHPTLYFRDTNQMSAMIHNNGNLLYILRGGTDTETWSQVNGQWPWIFNLSNNDSTCGGTLYGKHYFGSSGINVYAHSSSVPGYNGATWSDHIYMSNYYRRWSMGCESSGSYAMGFFRWSGSNGGARYINGYIHGNYYNRHMNNFTGQHRTFIENISHKSAINYEGLIVSANKNRYIKMSDGVEHGNKAITINESLPVVSLSNVSMDKSCFGVISSSEDPENRTESFGKFVSVFDKELGDTRIYINSVGEGAIWVTNINGNLESGDYITTSNIAGYGMKQESDSLKNYTVAKITMDCDFNPRQQPVKRILKKISNVNYWVKTTKIDIYEDEYNLLDETDREISYDEESNPIYKRIETHEVDKDPNDDTYIMETREEMVNVLDANDEFQWEDTGELEYAYNIKYITSNGTETDEGNANYIAAFVGCTYHCG